MTDSTRSPMEDRVDRYVRGELTPAEARELAQQSLDDQELFEELTSSAYAKAALSAPSARELLKRPDAAAKLISFPHRARIWGVGVAAAVGLVFVSVYWLRSSGPRANPGTRLTPALASSANPDQPILLAGNLQAATESPTPVFRGQEPGSRTPRQRGSIVSIEDGVASIDLGSVDGLAKGIELQVYRDGSSTQPIGRLEVTTVFRERARGRIRGTQEIPINGQVRVSDSTYLGALLEQVDALSARGDFDGARTAAQKAAEWAETANLPVRERSVALNSLAVLRLLRGDYDGAEAPLSQVVSTLSKADVMYGRIVNNLGVLAELRGDRQKAETLYGDALNSFASFADSLPQERQAVEKNLARVKALR